MHNGHYLVIIRKSKNLLRKRSSIKIFKVLNKRRKAKHRHVMLTLSDTTLNIRSRDRLVVLCQVTDCLVICILFLPTFA